MFQNRLQSQQSNEDPFDSMGKIDEASLEEKEHSPFLNPDYITAKKDPDLQFVEPHYVMSYTRNDGTHVEGYWRDGDGNTSVDRSFEDGGGYLRSTPDGDPSTNLGF
ncbi:hypothetical protein [Halalkalibacter alkaliphilus]|uniref:Uncharacterized protein n=1 Tax=Halalkalibacter alkaliphilus TaxID=2917993 RepID=A0A9X2CUW4_9BACI|nr:hypothetical protein [Halalkalibacter alkaliphilus]MCL7748751.1 hypothetical protein [Halalkalibacter alkaliphilus]